MNGVLPSHYRYGTAPPGVVVRHIITLAQHGYYAWDDGTVYSYSQSQNIWVGNVHKS